MSTVTVADVEWVLSRNEWTVEHFRGHLVLPFKSGINLFVSVLPVRDIAFVWINTFIGNDLHPSPSLYRWVATQAGEGLVGSMDADVNDDGLVDVKLNYCMPAQGFTDDTVDTIILAFASRANDLREIVKQMFV